MISWLRYVMRKNALLGIMLTALYLLGRYTWTKRTMVLGSMAAGLAAVWITLSLFRVEPNVSPRGPAGPSAYTITDLGALPGGDGVSWAADINDAGQVVGSSHTEGNRKPHAFLWQNGRMTDLGALAGGTSYALQLNASGLIVGTSCEPEGPFRAVVWRDAALTTLDVGGSESMALGVNDRGEVVGSLGFGHNFGLHAFFWNDDTSADIGPFLAHSINADAQIAGYEIDARTATAVLYSKGETFPLLTLGGDFSVAYAINDKCQIAGMCTLESGEGIAVVWEGNGIRQLGTLGGRNGWAQDINTTGEVVGSADTAQNQRHAFFWQNGEMIDLNTVLPADSGWVLRSANGINARGQIVGHGEKEGKIRAFLLTPH